jgi:DNA polymerase I-like protein with 3'-5' exonuclease and polymerase domains
VQRSIDRLSKDTVALDEEIQRLTAEAAQMRLELDASEPLRAVIPSTHPAAILRGGAGVAGAHAPDLAFFNLIYDVGKIAAIAAGKDIRFHEDIETAYESPARAEWLIEKILWAARTARFLAVDTETYVVDEKRHNALQPLNAKIRAIGLATAEFGISVAWRVLTDRARRLIAALLADPGILKICHNVLYDRPVLEHNGMPIRGPVDDTLLLHHCAFPGLTHRLQQVTTQFFAMPPWKAEFRAGDDTLPDLTRYNALDTLSTARIHGPLIIAVKKMGTERAYEMDLKMARVAEKMHVVGVPVSREVNQQLYDQFAAHMVTARKTIEDKANDPAILAKLWERLAFEQAKRTRKGDPEDFNERIAKRLDLVRQAHADGKWKWTITASDHVVAYLKARGVPMYTPTDSGKTKCSKDILENFSHLPEVRALLDYRENQKLLSTFCYRMFDRQKGNETVYGYVDENDRIHPRWNVHRITSRWSAEEPSVQNTPKADKKKGRPNLRLQFVAPPGRVFVGFDFCLAGGTLVDTPNGAIPIEHLKVGDFVFSFNAETERPACSKIVGVKATGVRETLKVILDNDAAIRCTPDHRWIVYDGSEIRAADLVAGTRLLPLRRGRAGPKNSEQHVGVAKGTKWTDLNHKVVAVIYDGLFVPTYDIEVEHDHNFALAAGVFVHNCQLEARIIALLSGDPFLVDIFASGKDVHSEFARVVLPDFDSRPIDERKKLRDQVKRLEFGAFYGGQADSLYKKVAPDFPDLKLADVVRLVQVMSAKTGGVTAWHQDLLRSVALPPHELRSLLYSRCRNFPLGNADVNDTYNWPVQTCGAEIMNTGVDRMEGSVGKYRDCWAILQIHDAAVYECYEDDADKVKADVVDCFTQELFNSEKGVTLKFPVDVKVAKSWAEV